MCRVRRSYRLEVLENDGLNNSEPWRSSCTSFESKTTVHQAASSCSHAAGFDRPRQQEARTVTHCAMMFGRTLAANKIRAAPVKASEAAEPVPSGCVPALPLMYMHPHPSPRA